MNDSMKPSHEKKKARPAIDDTGFKMGRLRAFRLSGERRGAPRQKRPIVWESGGGGTGRSGAGRTRLATSTGEMVFNESG